MVPYNFPFLRRLLAFYARQARSHESPGSWTAASGSVIKPSYGNLCFSRRFVCRRMPCRLECPDKGRARPAIDNDLDFRGLRHRGARVFSFRGPALLGSLAVAGGLDCYSSGLFRVAYRKLSHRRSWSGLSDRARLGSTAYDLSHGVTF